MSMAEQVLAEIETAGASAKLRDGKLVVAPSVVLSAELRQRIRPAARDLVVLLRAREPEHGQAARSASRVRSSCCELRRFPDRPDRLVVRLCCEQAHRHDGAESIPVFQAEEIDLLLEWASAAGVSRFDPWLRDALLDLKLHFGGRIDPESIDRLRRPT
jgi:hypothetical protein